MAEMFFDGRQFGLQEDDGRKIILLDAGNPLQNASDRSMTHPLHDGFGYPTGREAPLLPQIVAALQHLAGETAGEDAVAGLLVASHLLRTPGAARILFVSASTGNPLLQLLAELLPEMVRNVCILAATDLEDESAVPAGVLPIRTRLSELSRMDLMASVLVFDGRFDMPERAAAWQQSLQCLAPLGTCFALGLDEDDVRQAALQQVQSLALGGQSIYCGQHPFDRQARPQDAILAARKKLAETIRFYLDSHGDAGASLDMLIHQTRSYTELLTEHRAQVFLPDERYQAAVLLERLYDISLGQAPADTQGWLSREAERLAGAADRSSQEWSGNAV